ncbi:MAG: 50S ribosomal protein L25 [Candidatus Yanofskybacteria bacterium GW2011_GWA1_44_21]|uniref:Large ribosomal subunit protein bL25 n=2 Tax=Candidatus Yanofskyibacteriota TaxID=1752733 RepID=A0A1F8H1I5_9BACT|nr:MAG: 50S ribosomal protein L25 [Candidatus Yanofskybacteria bacterium GW2011_GWA1_44_21]KKT89932.1 MAG: 50S ribosomal protein L25 [Candidatus Yanofskybacteria bacterium GW2011_GWB1_45_11]OGN02758.1 MAG: hypothetical protein A2657_01275 [Candidatus Yanofskybacteria bacterium RIFCSPHIGHO2_01_FULL_44_110b]OGN27237.1 MAG: hypothetical protein A3B12_01935 [Candidatus Yanofskybacteria bacterium RIFCSPLOWO2_01_FULL_44_88]OGN30736.1 MAG: hypothetical protein A3I96_00190 [Candidatus Yanofskybacteria 
MSAAKTHNQKVELDAQVRAVLGSGVKALRRQGVLPGVLYGKGLESLNLQIPLKDFSGVLKSAGESTLVYLNLDGKTYPTIIHDVVYDPVTDEVLHADFYKVRLDEKIKAMVQASFVGESPAVRDLGGIFIRNVNELEVEALPQDLPHEITVDISNLKNFGDQILVKDIKLESGVKLTASEDEIVGTVQEPITQEQLEKELETKTSIEDVEVIEKKKPEDEAVVEEMPESAPDKEQEN